MRALIYVHFDRDGIVDPHVEFALSQYRTLVDHLVFVSASVRELTAKQKSLVDSFIARENIGYDFGSWKDGFRSLDVNMFEELLFANDSVYGPLWSAKDVIEFGKDQNLDFWGMVMSDQTISEKQFYRHIQSWFFGVRKRLLASAEFDGFWTRIEPVSSKREIIRRFEIGLTETIVEARARIGAVHDTKKGLLARLITGMQESSPLAPSRSWRLLRRCIRRNRNPAEADWETLWNSGVPFLKVSLFRLNPYGRNLASVIKRIANDTDYDPRLIEDHVRRNAR